MRRLLFDAEHSQLTEIQQTLSELEKRITEPELRVADVSEILPSAIDQSVSKNEKLGDALKPVLVNQFHLTAREEPDVMADALFPILGPAIRKMITAMLTPDSASNRRYKVEQAFLINNETGLHICHASGQSVAARDADMVSGMLSAIQSFVHEAFSANEFDGLDKLQVGEVSVWIEWGPHALLAVVVRGIPPQRLREAMQIQLESIHQQYARPLSNYDGNNEPFAPIQPVLVKFLNGHDGSVKAVVGGLSEKAIMWIAVATAAALFTVLYALYNWHESNRWQAYLQTLNSEPGYVIVSDERQDGAYRVRGLRDPMARKPSELFTPGGIDADAIRFDLKPYQSLEGEFILKRLNAFLDPPASIKLSLDGTTLSIIGVVDKSWKARADQIVQAMPGIDTVIYLPK